MSNVTSYENFLRECLRDLFRTWEITFEYHQHPDSCYDFYLPVPPVGGHIRIGFYVVLEAAPGLRQDDIASLMRQGNQVIILDRTDLLDLNRSPGPASAQGIVGRWMRGERTCGSATRRAHGFHGMLGPSPASTCECIYSCADDPATACSLSGQFHVHPGEPCPVHPGAPGDR